MMDRRKFIKRLTDRYRNRLRLLHLCNYVLFSVFCFCFLYGMESYILLLTFLKITGCHFPDLPGLYALSLTVILVGVHILVNAVLKFKGQLHAVSFLPSFLLLAFLTCLVPDFSLTSYFPLVLGLALFVFLTFFRQYGFRKASTFSRLLIPNLVCMLGCFLFVTFIGNTNDKLHYELRIQNLYMKGKYEKALQIGNESLVTGRRLTALRALALSRTNKLGESLFEYPIEDNCTDLFLHPSDAAFMILPLDSVRNVLGYLPTEKNYLQEMYRRSGPSSHVSRVLADYRLCTLLLQKRLFDFATLLPRFYDLKAGSRTLPKHYREALILYRSLSVYPHLVYKGTPTEVTNYTDFIEMSKKYADPLERKNRLRRLYGNTYWWYYLYASDKIEVLSVI